MYYKAYLVFFVKSVLKLDIPFHIGFIISLQHCLVVH